MRKALVVVVVLFAVRCFAQQSGGNGASSSGTVKVSGCVMSLGGSFRLLTQAGSSYVLKGDHDTLFSYNGMLVEVKGTVSPGKKSSSQGAPVTLHVSKLKKLADTCQ